MNGTTCDLYLSSVNTLRKTKPTDGQLSDEVMFARTELHQLGNHLVFKVKVKKTSRCKFLNFFCNFAPKYFKISKSECVFLSKYH